MKQTLFMETTTIEPQKTVAEIQSILAQYGASAIQIDYENNEVSAVSFLIKLGENELPFRLPCRWEAVLDVLERRLSIKIYHTPEWKAQKKKDLIAQAKRVAWRQILRWIQAQMALVETNMVKIQEIFLPYFQTGINETLYDKLEQSKFKMIEYKK